MDPETSRLIIQKLGAGRVEICRILALYGASKVRIWGLPETDCAGEPDVDVLVSFDESDRDRPVLVCLRNQFLRKIRGQIKLDEDGWLLCERISSVLNIRVNGCQEGAVKSFHPVTYEKTLVTHEWDRVRTSLAEQ